MDINKYCNGVNRFLLFNKKIITQEYVDKRILTKSQQEISHL